MKKHRPEIQEDLETKLEKQVRDILLNKYQVKLILRNIGHP
jgi:hypothetical protein